MMIVTVIEKLKEELVALEFRLHQVIGEFSSDEFTASRFYEATGGEPAEIALAKEAIELRAKRRELRTEIKAMELVNSGENWTLDEGNSTLYVGGIVLDMKYVNDRIYTGGPSSMSYVDASYWASPLGGISVV